MKQVLYVIIVLFCFSSFAAAGEGLISVKSSYDAGTTADRLVTALEAQGMTVFIRINHADGARKAGMELRPTELVIFGNPKVGTPLMQCGRSVAIDLPQKALIREDENGQVWYSYNDPAYLAERHGITGCKDVIKKIRAALANFSKAATGAGK